MKMSCEWIRMKTLAEALHMLDGKLKEKLMRLIEWYKSMKGPVVVAFSGGVDSSVVLATAVIALGSEKVIAVTAISPTYPEEDLEWAKRIVKLLGVKHILVKTDELSDPNFIRNPPNRCYFCKKSLIDRLMRIAREHHAKVIVEGTNASDLTGHRPGFLALKEAGVRSPLAEVGITKEEVRAIAKALGLPNWNKPSMACLASRIP
ncbi:MAG: ATP-dependent sacrificial sulfur transferase LarE, partial [Thermoprotei archaeon]